ncbi:MAG: hypothetical protein V4498_09430, partial [candidate division FCPU426 bacterium]
DYDKLVARLEDLKKSTQDLTERMDNLHPMDGVKIHGRAITTYSDLHLTGPAALNFGQTVTAKTLGNGIRYEGGLNRVDVDFELTRGMLSGVMEVNLEGAWGSGGAAIGFRQFYIEVRSPLAIQFGQVQANLTPLTLWRNEDPNPYEPEPFKSRRQRARYDLQLVPDKEKLTGLRLSTELWLFDSVTLDLSSTSALIAHPFNLPGIGFTGYFGPNPPSAQFAPANSTYLEAWHMGLIFQSGLDISWNGTLFFDDTQSRPISGYRSLNEMVNSARVRYERGMFYADAEIAISSYTAPVLTTTAIADPLTGTAVVANVGIKGALGAVKAYFRSVSAGYHAAGAQTRTQDANFEFLGPLMTEITQVGVAPGGGTFGVGLGMAPSPEPVWNSYGIIAPGSFLKAPTLVYAGVFSHLLPYNYLNDISPYGMATPDRNGFGLDGQLNLLGGVLVAKGGFDMANNNETVLVQKPSRIWAVDNAGNTAMPTAVTLPFSYQAIRIGADVNLKFKWPVKVTLGWTGHDTRNGDLSWRVDAQGNPIPYALTSQLLQAGLELHLNPKLAFAVGYQHSDAIGFTDTITAYGYKAIGNAAVVLPGVTYDQVAYSVYWYITDAARVDLLYENLIFSATDSLSGRWEADSGLIRFQIDF